MKRNIAVIGVGNMARAIISGILSSSLNVDKFYVYDKFPEAYGCYKDNDLFCVAKDVKEAVEKSDCVLLAVKPQNYSEVLEEIRNAEAHDKKLYISIGAGITVQSVSDALDGAVVIRVLPNLPMTIGQGVSAICKNDKATAEDFEFVKSAFASAGSTLVIDECEMNRIIGVTSSSPAYVFKFIDAICKGAEAQGLDGSSLLDAVCDMIIGSAMLLKNSADTPEALISKVASKGGTTERALNKLNEGLFNETVKSAMIACTARADELGKQ